jgi:hypothetical protein
VGDEAATVKLDQKLWFLRVGQAGGFSPWNGEREGHVGSGTVIGGAVLLSDI